MLSIHNNLSAGVQNVTGTVAKQLCNMQMLVQGYNLEVHDVTKYTRKHRATITNYITCKPGLCLT